MIILLAIIFFFFNAYAANSNQTKTNSLTNLKEKIESSTDLDKVSEKFGAKKEETKEEQPNKLGEEKSDAIIKSKDEPEGKIIAKEKVIKPTKKQPAKIKRQAKINKKQPRDTGVELNLENTSIESLMSYVSDLFESTFIIEEPAAPTAPQPSFGMQQEKRQTTKSLAEVKITYKSHITMSEKQIWSLLDLFLDNAGYARVAQKNIGSGIFRIVPTATSNKLVLPVFIGTNPSELPNDGRIRYIYFVQNTSVDQLKDFITRIKSSTSTLEVFTDLRALIITDNAYNIKSMFQIVKELDTGVAPESLSILKLQNAEANDVAQLYETLKGKDDPLKRPFETKKIASTYFPQNAKVIPEPRTNSLIILGPKDAVRRIEDFVVSHLDTTLKKLPSPIHVYQLNFAPAQQLADILNNATQFGQGTTAAAEYGGVRGGEKFFTKMFVQADAQGNRLLFRCSEEDFKLIVPTIKELDQIQPQVVIEVLIVSLRLDKNKAIQSALRNKDDSKVNFQTSGFFGQGIQVNSTNFNGSLITNLINLATSAIAGTTILSLGKESVWALIGILDQTTEVNIVSNPFLVATNKYQASVGLGQTRRVVSGQVLAGGSTSQNTLSDMNAFLQVNITPQISSFGVINLDIEVKIEQFTSADPSNGNKSVRVVKTNADVANNEILALGGLIQNTENNNNTGVPILSKIPIVGYLFKNKTKTHSNDNLLIFMTPKIVTPKQAQTNEYTKIKAQYVREMLCEMDAQESQRDPIYKWWFKEQKDTTIEILNNMMQQNEPSRINQKIKKVSLKNIGEEK